MADNVRHDSEGSRFVIDLADGEAVLEYAHVDGRTVDYRSVRVPPQHRGEGIAARLVTHALEYAREHGLRIIPSCSYARRFIAGHPAYADLVATGD